MLYLLQYAIKLARSAHAILHIQRYKGAPILRKIEARQRRFRLLPGRERADYRARALADREYGPAPSTDGPPARQELEGGSVSDKPARDSDGQGCAG